MARAPNEKVNKAYELFKEGYKLIDISKKLDIPSSTVRRLKKIYIIKFIKESILN